MRSIVFRASAVLLAAGIAGGACASSPAQPEPRTATVSRGGITQTVAVSGSVNAAAQTRLAFKTAGRIAEIEVTAGQTVAVGQALAKLDTSDLEVAVAQAQASVAGAQAKYDQTVAGATPEDVALARQAVDNAAAALDAAQRNGGNDVSAAVQTLSRTKTSFTGARATLATLTGDIRGALGTFSVDALVGQLSQARTDLNAILNANGANPVCSAPCVSPAPSTPTATDGKAAQSSLSSAAASLANAQTALASLPQALADYGTASDGLVDIATRFDAAIQSGADTSALSLSFQSVATQYAAAQVRLSALVDQVNTALGAAGSSITAAQASFATTASRNDQSYDSIHTELLPIQQSLSGLVQSLSIAKTKLGASQTPVQTLSDATGGGYAQAVQSAQSVQDRTTTSVQSAQNALHNANLSLAKTTAPAQSYDIASAYASLLAAQANLRQAQTNLDGGTLRAPSAGVVASVSQQVGELTTGTLIVLANVSTVVLHGTVGEADVAKLALGQVATITIDAVGTARMTGKVTSLDPVATIQQGVPVYGVDVQIDIPSAAVRPGMSGTANVIIVSKQNTLVVPNLALKTQGGRRYVTVLKEGQQVDTDVEVGVSNDTQTEIASGVDEGTTVVLPQPRATGSNRPVQFGPGGRGPGG